MRYFEARTEKIHPYIKKRVILKGFDAQTPRNLHKTALMWTQIKYITFMIF